MTASAPVQNRFPITAASWSRAFCVGLEQIETGGDQPLDGLRDLALAAAVAQHPRELLGVEGIAARTAEQLDLRLGGQDGAEQLVQERRGVVVAERRERDRQRVRLPASPAGPPA